MADMEKKLRYCLKLWRDWKRTAGPGCQCLDCVCNQTLLNFLEDIVERPDQIDRDLECFQKQVSEKLLKSRGR